MSAIEQRQYPRQPLQVPALLLLQGQQVMNVRTMDVSIGGLCVSSPITVDKGTPCMVRFTLPLRGGDRQVMEFRGRVAYCMFSSTHGVKLGLSFVEPSEAWVDMIGDYVRARTPMLS